jgi:hypothetical protein
MKMYETQTSEPEKQTGEMESGEVKNTTTDKVIVKPDNLRSTVWRFFGFWSVGGKVVDKSKAVCKLCDAELAYHSNTTNLRMHLIVVHPTEWNKVGEDEKVPFLQWVIYFPKSTRSRQELLNTICMGS